MVLFLTLRNFPRSSSPFISSPMSCVFLRAFQAFMKTWWSNDCCPVAVCRNLFLPVYFKNVYFCFWSDCDLQATHIHAHPCRGGLLSMWPYLWFDKLFYHLYTTVYYFQTLEIVASLCNAVSFVLYVLYTLGNTSHILGRREFANSVCGSVPGTVRTRIRWDNRPRISGKSSGSVHSISKGLNTNFGRAFCSFVIVNNIIFGGVPVSMCRIEVTIFIWNGQVQYGNY